MQGLTGLLVNASPSEVLMKLAEKGLVHADSFVPVRQWLCRDKLLKASVRQRAKSLVMALTAGRWELSRPVIESTFEQQLEQAFDRASLLCRETAHGLSCLWR